jgi:outer membrane protein
MMEVPAYAHTKEGPTLIPVKKANCWLRSWFRARFLRRIKLLLAPHQCALAQRSAKAPHNAASLTVCKGQTGRRSKRHPMKKITPLLLTALLAAAPLAGTAQAAGSAEGKFQFKVLATAVLPDGAVKSVKTDILGLVPATVGDTKANDNVTPTVALEYFFTPHFSVETIAGVTAHHVSASAGALKGTPLISKVYIVPATLTAKYHINLAPGIKPYIGAGPTLFLVVADEPSAELKAALPAVTRTKLTSELGVAVQAGVDIALGKGYGLALDAKKYWVGTEATVYAGSTKALVTTHRLDPWVLSAGVSYRF